ncbi:MAG: hypothetical protein HDS52_07555 [Barnesiella sp.]|nr:hypothetical protein [Barnesiella sp.]
MRHIKQCLLIFIILRLFVGCTPSESAYTIDGTELKDFPEVEFLWNYPINFDFGLPGAGPIVFKNEDGSYISRDANKDYAEWCEYIYLLDKTETEWFRYFNRLTEESRPELADADIRSLMNGGYRDFYNQHPEIFKAYVEGVNEIQPSLNLYLTGNKDKISNPILADIIDEIYQRDHKYLMDFEKYEGSKDPRDNFPIDKENPHFKSNGLIVSFFQIEYEPYSIVDYRTIDGENIPLGTLWVSCDREIKYADD